MQILLVAASSLELSYFEEISRQPDLKFSVSLFTSGVGLTASAYSLTKKLLLSRPDLVIAVGISGAFQGRGIPGEIREVREEIIADQGAGEDEDFKDLFELSLADAGEKPYIGGVLPNKWRLNQPELKSASVAKALTVNHIRTNPKSILAMQQKFQADIESMEGAAVHYVCLQEDIPFLHLRGISNIVGERNKAKWKIAESLENLARLLADILSDERLIEKFSR